MELVSRTEPQNQINLTSDDLVAAVISCGDVDSKMDIDKMRIQKRTLQQYNWRQAMMDNNKNNRVETSLVYRSAESNALNFC